MLVAAFPFAIATAFAQDPRAVTTIGSDANIRRCSEAVVAGDSSDRTVEECTRALNYRRIDRATQLQLLINRGVTHMRRGENEPALQDFDEVIRLDRHQAEAHLNRGAVLVQMRQHGQAIAAITEALGLGVREPHKAYFNRGAAREALGDLRGAYEDYSTALEIQPDWGPASAELARFARGRRDHLATVLNEPTP
ncbi:MAG TPA: tetratricopeptide repeat protein [Verrucomicrobiae bacterium]|nr:tetratricopeptide repeat protein [Verrucomicrobiae bacterium]